MQNDLLGAIATALTAALPDLMVREPEFGVVKVLAFAPQGYTMAEISVVDVTIHAALDYANTTRRTARMRKQYDARDPSSLQTLIADIISIPKHEERADE